MELLQPGSEKFDGVVDHFKQSLTSLRTGRANAALVENISIDVYGSKTPLMHVASVSVPDAKTIAIQPWDKTNLGPIEKAIQISNVGLQPVNDGILIRLSVPPMTEERRKEMVKVIGQLSEEARVGIRSIREDLWKDIKRQEDDNEMTSDDVVDAKEDLQKVVDAYNEKIKDLAATKEKEIMTI
jgi:ribosome recycling factor